MPGSITFLLVGLAVALVLTAPRRTSRWGKVLLVALVGGYWLLATLSVSSVMANVLSMGFRPIDSPAEVRGASAVVVLGGGAEHLVGRQRTLEVPSLPSASRVLEAARIYHLLGTDPWVVTSGGPTDPRAGGPSEAAAMRDVLLRLGVPAGRILLETASRTTHEEAVDVPPILRAHGIRQFILVTSPTHMLRALASFRAQGVDPVPAIATGFRRRPRHPIDWILPTGRGLELGQMALHEYMGLVYYGVRGWLRF